jgi:hypothetical protein
MANLKTLQDVQFRPIANLHLRTNSKSPDVHQVATGLLAKPALQSMNCNAQNENRRITKVEMRKMRYTSIFYLFINIDTVKPWFTYYYFWTYYSKYVLEFNLRTLLNVLLKLDLRTSFKKAVLKFKMHTFPQYAYWITEYVMQSMKAPSP